VTVMSVIVPPPDHYYSFQRKHKNGCCFVTNLTLSRLFHCTPVSTARQTSWSNSHPLSVSNPSIKPWDQHHSENQQPTRIAPFQSNLTVL